MSDRVLLVDDDVNLLQGLRRHLRKKFDLELASGGEAGLETLRTSGPFAVVVSDMQMPGMTGVEFLGRCRQVAPDATRIMLTGNADQGTAVQAVNDGQIFRFLNKPCTQEDLAKAIAAGVRQHRLVTAERELLSRTLTGSVKVLTDVLSLTRPNAFTQCGPARRLMHQLAAHFPGEAGWEWEIAAMLAQIGFVSLPTALVDKAVAGSPLSAEEASLFQRHPEVAAELIGNIPRLENVSMFVALQDRGFDGSGRPADAPTGLDLPLGARVLRVVVQFLNEKHAQKSDAEALEALQRRSREFDPRVLDALRDSLHLAGPAAVESVPLAQLREGDFLVEPIVDNTGALLVKEGHEVSAAVLAKLAHFASRGIREPICIAARGGAPAAPARRREPEPVGVG
ncbi:MAG: response regulator [Planctomycetales bacterium]|nr:response regulator [Planctomycetales bacterium]